MSYPKGRLPSGDIPFVAIVLHSLALYSVIELLFIIFATFKRRSGL